MTRTDRSSFSPNPVDFFHIDEGSKQPFGVTASGVRYVTIAVPNRTALTSAPVDDDTAHRLVSVPFLSFLHGDFPDPHPSFHADHQNMGELACAEKVFPNPEKSLANAERRAG